MKQQRMRQEQLQGPPESEDDELSQAYFAPSDSQNEVGYSIASDDHLNAAPIEAQINKESFTPRRETTPGIPLEPVEKEKKKKKKFNKQQRLSKAAAREQQQPRNDMNKFFDMP